MLANYRARFSLMAYFSGPLEESIIKELHACFLWSPPMRNQGATVTTWSWGQWIVQPFEGTLMREFLACAGSIQHTEWDHSNKKRCIDRWTHTNLAQWSRPLSSPSSASDRMKFMCSGYLSTNTSMHVWKSINVGSSSPPCTTSVKKDATKKSKINECLLKSLMQFEASTHRYQTFI